MKKRVYLFYLSCLILLFLGCYKDTGNYNYDNLEEVMITLPEKEGAYEIKFGEKLTIPVAVTSDLPLKYAWEIYGIKDSITPRGYHVNVFGFFEIQGQEFATLDHKMGPDEFIQLTGTYELRLKVMIDGTSLIKYSPIITVNVTGEAGLIVLHGDNSQCDIGVVTASEFLVNPGSVDTKIYPTLYSDVNGEKIQGKGFQIVHFYQQYIPTTEHFHVIVLTEDGGIYADPSGMVKKGDYRDMFYNGAGGTLNAGKPAGFIPNGFSKLVIDDGEIFFANGHEKFIMKTSFVLGVFNGPETTCNATYPIVNLPSVGYVIFDLDRRGLVKVNAFFDGTPTLTVLSSEHADIDPGDMKSDMIHLDRGGRQGHVIGVFEDVNGKYIAEFDFMADNSKANPYLYGKYDVMNLQDFGSSIFYAFGNDQINMCYYATSTNVYRYSVHPDLPAPTSKRLSLQNGTPLEISGEITMMKILKPYSFSPYTYQHYNQMLVIGTYEHGVGTIYACVIDQSSGEVISYKTYTGFDCIIDANIKVI